MKGFKDFITRGNLLDMAVAFIMGAAFTTVVTAFTKLIMSIISKVLGGVPNFDNVALFGIAIGPFISAVINFLLVALVVYLCIVKPMNLWHARHPAPKAPVTEIDLLTDIRDTLKAGQPSGSATPAA
ncbi:MAG: large conductance mechanosensitive channel protein MscL [Propionibacteriaceae bacterium]|jgi:large conductance mechanosensitive channel|nr:large conductance mechanosensitive channel protein MscL [Propionibacteriaceae bacterium]